MPVGVAHGGQGGQCPPPLFGQQRWACRGQWYAICWRSRPSRRVSSAGASDRTCARSVGARAVTTPQRLVRVVAAIVRACARAAHASRLVVPVLDACRDAWVNVRTQRRHLYPQPLLLSSLLTFLYHLPLLHLPLSFLPRLVQYPPLRVQFKNRLRPILRRGLPPFRLSSLRPTPPLHGVTFLVPNAFNLFLSVTTRQFIGKQTSSKFPTERRTKILSRSCLAFFVPTLKVQLWSLLL